MIELASQLTQRFTSHAQHMRICQRRDVWYPRAGRTAAAEGACTSRRQVQSSQHTNSSMLTSGA
jgi:hypothetical protein